MTTFVITYDLKTPGQDYQTLYDELNRLSAHRALESFWLLSVNNTAQEVHDHLKSFIDSNDSLFVAELTKNKHYSGARSGTNDWLRANPPSR